MNEHCGRFDPAIPLAYADSLCRCGVSRLNGGHGGGYVRTVDVTGVRARVVAEHDMRYHPGRGCVEDASGRCTELGGAR